MLTLRPASAAVLWVTTIVIAACGNEPPVTRGAPSAGAEFGGTTPAPTVPMSRFDVPVRYDFTDMLDVVEHAVPAQFGSLDTRISATDDTRKQYAFAVQRSPFTAFAHGTEVHLRTVLHYTARGWYKTPLGPTVSAGCGRSDSEDAQFIVELVTPLQMASNWHLKSAARIAQLSMPADSDRYRCRVSLLNFDVTDKVLEAARAAITARLPDIDKRVAQVDLTTKAASWWKQLSKPLKISDNVWLLLQPQQLRLKGMTGEQSVLTVQAGLDAYPVIVTGLEPSSSLKPLPPLSRDTGSTGFRVLVDATIGYATASAALSRQLLGKTSVQGGRYVVVTAVEASSAPPDKLAFSVTFNGDATGVLKFIGTPKLHADSGIVTVTDLDYDLSTDSDLINAYSWLKSDALLETFRARARLDLAPAVALAQSLVTKALNRTIGGVMSLSAIADSVAFVGLRVTPEGLLARAFVSGDARVSVRPRSTLTKQ